MNKSIEETHPSLCDKYGDMLMVVQDLQEHTIDKAVLKKVLDSWIRHYDKHYELYGDEYDIMSNAIKNVKKELELEEQ